MSTDLQKMMTDEIIMLERNNPDERTSLQALIAINATMLIALKDILETLQTLPSELAQQRSSNLRHSGFESQGSDSSPLAKPKDGIGVSESSVCAAVVYG